MVRQEQVRNVFCFKNCTDFFTIRMNCSTDLKSFANSQPTASNFKKNSQSLEQFLLTESQNNFGNKMPNIEWKLRIEQITQQKVDQKQNKTKDL